MKVLICGFLAIENIQEEVTEFSTGILWSEFLYFSEACSRQWYPTEI